MPVNSISMSVISSVAYGVVVSEGCGEVSLGIGTQVGQSLGPSGGSGKPSVPIIGPQGNICWHWC